jgi:hypothetical protein
MLVCFIPKKFGRTHYYTSDPFINSESGFFTLFHWRFRNTTIHPEVTEDGSEHMEMSFVPASEEMDSIQVSLYTKGK